MSRKRLAIAVGVLAIAGAAATVHAQGRGWHGGPMMLGGDDGARGMHGWFGRSLTKDESEARARERFARLDKNSDGVIDASEIELALAARRGPGEASGAPGDAMLRRLGAGADGKLTREKFRAEVTRHFAEADLNNDGRIDDADLPPMLRGRNALARIAGGADGMRHGGPFGWLGMLAVTPKDGALTRDDVLAAADRKFDQLDRNRDGVVDKADVEAGRKEMADYAVKRFLHQYGADKDGRVTREQFMAKAAERFARLDLNGDGTISRDELPRGGFGRHGRHGRQADAGFGPDGPMMGPGMHRGPHGFGHGMAGPPPPPPGDQPPPQKK